MAHSDFLAAVQVKVLGRETKAKASSTSRPSPHVAEAEAEADAVKATTKQLFQRLYCM